MDTSESEYDMAQLVHELGCLGERSAGPFAARVAYFNGSREGQRLISNGMKRYERRQAVSLPRPTPLTGSLERLLQSRRSCRDFTGQSIEAGAVNALLQRSLGASRQSRSTIDPDIQFHLKPYPAAGAIYTAEVYPILLRVETIERGIYHYSGSEDKLSRLGEAPHAAVLRRVFGTDADLMDRAALVLAVTVTLRRSMRKYGGRGYRFAMIEVGGIVQTLGLAAAALNIGMVAWGGYKDRLVERLLNVDGIEERMAAAAIFGDPQR